MKRLILLAVTLGVLTWAASTGAITFGTIDGNAHPNVGALIAEWDAEEPGVKKILCSGALVRKKPSSGTSNVFVTASHCTAFLESIGIEPDEVWVTFDPQFDETNPGASTLIPGVYHTHPDFGFSGSGGFSDPHDVAVVKLSQSRSGSARLPTLNFLDSMNLKGTQYVAVGYGTVRDDKTGGFNTLYFDGKRRFATGTFNALNKSWLHISMNPSTGDGGTCYGDSGGPHFFGSTDINVSVTVTGDAPCRATDVTYRLDTRSARAFLDDFVTLP